MPAGTGGKARPAVIVMADDDPEYCLQATKALQVAGLVTPLTYVTNRTALMDHLQGRRVFGDGKPAPRPDLVLLDLDSAEMDGHRVLAEIAGNPAFQGSAARRAGRVEGGACGFTAGRRGRAGIRFPKPIEFGVLASAVAAFPSLALRLVTAAEETSGTGGAP